MTYQTYSRVDVFAKEVEPFLNEHEDLYSLFLGSLQQIKQGVYDSAYFMTVKKDLQLIGFAQMTPPFPLNLVLVHEDEADYFINELVNGLVQQSLHIPGVFGQKELVEKVALEWAKVTHTKATIIMKEGLYRLDQVAEDLTMSKGNWRIAEQKDIRFLENAIKCFEEDALVKPTTPQKQLHEKTVNMISHKEVFLWEVDGEIVSIMKKSRPTTNGVTVSLVFTPRDKRKKGYARTCVATCSKELLKEYKFCTLYTDLLNPTSNKIYKEIGYHQIAEFLHVGFESETK